MSLIKPFRSLRPAPGRARDVLAPPYDVLSSAEARLKELRALDAERRKEQRQQ